MNKVIFILLVCYASLIAESNSKADKTVLRFNNKGGLDAYQLKHLLKKRSDIREIIIEPGRYFFGIPISGPKGVDYSNKPLVIRAEKGGEVIFDGSEELKGFQATEISNVYAIDWSSDKTIPKLWEPNSRLRYTVSADKKSVGHFPGTYSIQGGKLYVQTSDGSHPNQHVIKMSRSDCGFFITRPNVKIVNIRFENYLRRDRWSTGISVRDGADGVMIDHCEAYNCSTGFTISGKNNTIMNSRVDDCGTGIYMQGLNTTVKNNRLFKIRDSFIVPRYPQEDSAILYYHPAKGGIVTHNLCVGFHSGIFLKAKKGLYRVEHNTLLGVEGCNFGFVSTKWGPKYSFKYNIVSNFNNLLSIRKGASESAFGPNCLWNGEVTKKGKGSVVADPQFFWPEIEDYRLQNDSPCLRIKSPSGKPSGAFPAIGNEIVQRETREIHVSQKGKNGFDGSVERPYQTIQFAINKAVPGDTIIIHPGVYSEPIIIDKGGMDDLPIVIQAQKKWEAIIDCNKLIETPLIFIKNASHVEIRDLQIRWYHRVAIKLDRAPNNVIIGCKIWNDLWKNTWPIGSAIRASDSPGLRIKGNICFRQEHGIWLHRSPKSVVVGNTCIGNMYSGISFLASIKDSICMNNSLAFQGNDTIVVDEDVRNKHYFKTFKCDYNNYATVLAPSLVKKGSDTLQHSDKYKTIFAGSKAIFNYNKRVPGKGQRSTRFDTMKAWQETTGLDRHSIFADPKYNNILEYDFRLSEDSPNLGAGKGGADIGALGKVGLSRYQLESTKFDNGL